LKGFQNTLLAGTMQPVFNAKTRRRKGARAGSETGSRTNAHHLVARAGMGKILLASLRLGVFALNSFCLIEWMRFSAFCRQMAAAFPTVTSRPDIPTGGFYPIGKVRAIA
jgi:hypothetical protein